MTDPLPDDDPASWFDEAIRVTTTTADQNWIVPSTLLYRCKVCAGLVEGSHRAAHRYWHLDKPQVTVDFDRPK